MREEQEGSEDDHGPPGPRGPASLVRGIRRFWNRHRTLFWTVHSGWALATGIVVVYLARERYGFVPWIVLFLALTWASTMFFGGRAGTGDDDSAADPESAPRMGDEMVSYVTRTLYQETLFFLLPLYAHSAVPGSRNLLFLGLLAGLAVLSCLDLVFDRWLRTRPTFGLVFFATVAFAAINLLLPLLLGLAPETATPVAALVAVGSAVPLAVRGSGEGRGHRILMSITAAALLLLAIGFPGLIPPVPLHMESATFSSGIDRETLEVADTLDSSASRASLDGAVYVLLEVLAPAVVPTSVEVVWRRDGQRIRTSRKVEITAHRAGFRVWDGWSPESGPVPPGRYEVTVRTTQGRVFGKAEIEVTGP